MPKKYIAKVGINFDGLKGKPRVEAEEPLPEEVSQKEIDQLIKDGFVEEVKEESLSSAVRNSGNSIQSLADSITTFQGNIKSAKEKQ